MTRGIRNNNPLNLRCSSSPWKGKGTPPSPLGKGEIEKDPEFEQFISMYYGFRAAILTTETYIIKHGCNTIRTIINRWAPPNENHTSNYINFVCRATGIGGNEVLSNHDKRLKEIVWAMAQMESGKGILEYKSSLDKAFDDFEPKEVYEKERKKQYAHKY